MLECVGAGVVPVEWDILSCELDHGLSDEQVIWYKVAIESCKS